jgi:hypothetical protein
MQQKNYINVVDKLNYELSEELINLGIWFEYTSNTYAFAITFIQGICVYDSEVDESVETEEELERIIREKVLTFTTELTKYNSKTENINNKLNTKIKKLLNSVFTLICMSRSCPLYEDYKKEIKEILEELS